MTQQSAARKQNRLDVVLFRVGHVRWIENRGIGPLQNIPWGSIAFRGNYCRKKIKPKKLNGQKMSTWQSYHLIEVVNHIDVLLRPGIKYQAHCVMKPNSAHFSGKCLEINRWKQRQFESNYSERENAKGTRLQNILWYIAFLSNLMQGLRCIHRCPILILNSVKENVKQWKVSLKHDTSKTCFQGLRCGFNATQKKL